MGGRLRKQGGFIGFSQFSFAVAMGPRRGLFRVSLRLTGSYDKDTRDEAQTLWASASEDGGPNVRPLNLKGVKACM